MAKHAYPDSVFHGATNYHFVDINGHPIPDGLGWKSIIQIKGANILHELAQAELSKFDRNALVDLVCESDDMYAAFVRKQVLLSS